MRTIKTIVVIFSCFVIQMMEGYAQLPPKYQNTERANTPDRLQKVVTLEIVDKNTGHPLPYAGVSIQPLNNSFVSDEKGIVTFSHAFGRISVLSVTATYVGRADVTITLTEKNIGDKIQIKLPDISLTLNNVEVNAQKKKAQSNSSLIIGRQAIESVQAYSMADVMQLLPGKAILNPDLQNAQFLTLRSAAAGSITNPLDAYSNGKMNDYMRNNAFGIGFFIDGAPVSNNANMQSDSYGKWGTIKVFDRHINPDNSNYVSSGIDLRQLPASSIESIEVISGVAPVKYGDISDGAVLVNRKAGITPYYASVKFQVGTTSYSFGKGLNLGKKAGVLSYNLDYLSGTSSANVIGTLGADKRNKLKSYNRVNADLIWTKTISEKTNWTNSLSLNLNTDLDGRKSDPDAYLKVTKSRNSGIRLADRGRMNWQNAWLDNINYNFAVSLSRQYNSHEEYMANAPQTFIADGMETGIYETDVTPPYYTSKMKIEGMPFNAFGQVEFGKTLSAGESQHHLTWGLGFNDDDNFGKGKIFDPDAPYYQSNIGGRGERLYDFRHKAYLRQFSTFFQDAFDISIGDKKLQTVAGVRLDKQGKWLNAGPRINSSINLSSAWQINAAYGISSKAPSTAYLYPENVYFDNLLIGRYDPDYNKRLYVIQTVVKSPVNPDLKSSTGTTVEAGVQYRNNTVQLSVTAYQKTNRNGISSRNILEYIQIPEYEVFVTDPDTKPTYYPTGKSSPYPVIYYRPENNLYSRNRGVELILNTKRIERLQTAFNLSATYIKSYYYKQGRYPGAEVNLEREAIAGIYEPRKQSSEDLISTLSVTHHIPVLGFILNWRLQNFWLRKTIGFQSDGLPVAYINQNFEEVPLTKEDMDSGRFTYLITDYQERYGVRQPKVITNYHIRLSKEILKNYTISFYANNLFNYRPYVEKDGVRTYFNQSPTFGVDISVKL
ncbi:MAG: TonB-dependent receptor [Niabella sp.]